MSDKPTLGEILPAALLAVHQQLVVVRQILFQGFCDHALHTPPRPPVFVPFRVKELLDVVVEFFGDPDPDKDRFAWGVLHAGKC